MTWLLLNFVRRYSVSHAKKVGFIGLGKMGHPMAYNLIKKGCEVVAYDSQPEALNFFSKLGATVTKSPAEVAEAAETIITMLPSSPHVRDVYLGHHGLFSAAKKDTLFIDSSTIDPMTSREVSAFAHKINTLMIDAPVSGGILAAEAGTLTFMVGGLAMALDRARPFLDKMGTNIIHCGDSGTGEIAKICNNMLLAITMIGTSEALHLGLKLGMDPKILSLVINSSSGKCWSSDKYNPCPGIMENVPSSKNYEGGFSSNLMLKDLNLAQSAMRATACEDQMTAGLMARDLYEQLVKEKLGNKDFSIIFQAYREGLFRNNPQLCEKKLAS